jgi:multidrug resistance efflux pump
MTAAEQQALAHARTRIEGNLAEIASLARDGRLPPRDFFKRFLALTLESVDAMGGAVWSIEQGQAHRVAEVSFASSGYESERQKRWVDQVLSHTVAASKPCVVAVQDQPPSGDNSVGNEVPHPFFYTPVVLDGQPRLVLQLWLKQAGDPRHYADIATFLDGLGQHACLYLRGAEQVLLRQDQLSSRHRLAMQDAMLGELNPTTLASNAANHIVDLLPCALGAVLRRRGSRWRLSAASNQETIDPAADQSQALARLAAVLPQSLDGDSFPSKEDGAPEGLDAALAATGYSALAWCHLRPSKKADPCMLLLACWHEVPANLVAARDPLRWSATQLARALDAATHFQSIPMRPVASAAARVLRAWNEDRRRRVLTWVGVPLVVVVAALLFPAPYKIKVDSSVVPAHTAVIVAETDGKIVEVPIAEGARVSAGQLLARLEDEDYDAQLAVATQQLSRHRVEMARAQAEGNEPERKIGELATRREEANLRRLEYLRSRTELRTPIDGIVLTRNVQHRVGEAMEVGKVFCEVGSSDAYELQLDLKQQDLGVLLGALQRGQPLPVDFILHAHARETLHGELSGTLQVSQLPETRPDQTVFVARIPLDQRGLEGGVKAGYTGKASIFLGHRPWGWLLLRPFLQYWRMNWSL